MSVAYIVVAVVVAFMLAMSARQKVVRDPRAVEIIGHVVGIPLRYFAVLASLEIAGAIGLLIGIAVPALGVAAGIGLVCYFVGAVGSHVRVHDLETDHLFPAVLMLVVSGAVLALRLLA
jgi:hypothetical protein